MGEHTATYKINNTVCFKTSKILKYIVIMLYSSHAHIHTHTLARAHTRTHTHTHARTHTHTHKHTHTRVHTRERENVTRGEGDARGQTGAASKKTQFEITCGIVCKGEFLTQF